MDDVRSPAGVSPFAMLPREEVDRRRRRVQALAAELERRGWHTSPRGIQMWVASRFLGPGREVGAFTHDFRWCKGSYSYGAIGPVDDIPGAADAIERELGEPSPGPGGTTHAGDAHDHI